MENGAHRLSPQAEFIESIFFSLTSFEERNGCDVYPSLLAAGQTGILRKHASDSFVFVFGGRARRASLWSGHLLQLAEVLSTLFLPACESSPTADLNLPGKQATAAVLKVTLGFTFEFFL